MASGRVKEIDCGLITAADINKLIYEKLAATPVDQSIVDAVTRWTRIKMWRLWHIPMKYFCPPPPGQEPEYEENFAKLWQTIHEVGYIDLDDQGQPCCLTGNPPHLAKLGIA